MPAERNSSLEFVLFLSVESEFAKKFKKNCENAGLWNLFVNVFTQHTTNVYVCSVS
jgi:hypothetical protein